MQLEQFDILNSEELDEALKVEIGMIKDKPEIGSFNGANHLHIGRVPDFASMGIAH